MPTKKPEVRRANGRAWYARHQTQEKARVVARRDVLISWLREYKSTLCCARCPENHPACLQFHHVDPAQKDLSLAKAVRQGWSVARLKAEIAKCEVLCANCHFKHHSGIV